MRRGTEQVGLRQRVAEACGDRSRRFPILILAAQILSAPAFAETVATSSDGQLRLRGLQETIDASEMRRKALAGDIESFKADRARFQANLLDVAKQTTNNETEVAAAEARLRALGAAQEQAKRTLDSRRTVVAEVLAALQRMGRKPPPALLVEPEDVLQAIRTSMLLGAVLPGMRREVEALAANLADLARTRQAIEAERKTLDAKLTALTGERARLTSLIEARQTALGKAQTDLDAEREKAKALAAQAGSVKDLIGRMEKESGDASQAAAAAQKSDAMLAAMPNGAGQPKDPARLAPAVSFASTRGNLPLPVAGSVLRRYGEDDGLGSTEKGALFASLAGATVVSPADGWIAYAGPYRSFGHLLILNVGGGYYIVLAGMDRVNVSLGQFVLAGEPVAAMGDGSTRTAAAVALAAAQPVLYVEFRKDGATIDPGPWWAKPELQKVHG